MQISQKTAVATHILSCLAAFEGRFKLTSDFLAGSTGVNAVIVRTLLGRLKKAGLADVAAGVGGARLARKPREITLLDVFKAVEDQAGIFALHRHPNPKCPVGRVIAERLTPRFQAARSALECELAKVTLAEITGHRLLQKCDTSGRRKSYTIPRSKERITT